MIISAWFDGSWYVSFTSEHRI